MNEWISQDDLKSLVESRPAPCLSLYLPTERVGPEGKKNFIRFKNLKRRAEKQNVLRGLRKTTTAELLAPLEKLLGNSLFWQNQSEGLAVFRSSDLFRFFRLPLRFKETLVVADRFHLKPLFPLFGEEGRFYILALSQKKIRLLKANRQDLEEVPLKNVPASLEESMKYQAPEKQLQFHTRTPPAMGRRSAMFHGHGGGVDESKEDLRRFCRLVERGVKRVLGKEGDGGSDPLDFAAVHTFLNGGTVYAVNPAEMPADGPVAALFRYR